MGSPTLETAITGETETGGGIGAQLIQFDLLAATDTIAIQAGFYTFDRGINALEVMFDLAAQLIGSIPRQIAAVRGRMDSVEVSFQL